MTSARNLSIFAPQVSQQGTLSYNNLVDKPQVITLKCTSIQYPGNDLAADPAGGQTITLIGTGFEATPTVYVGGVVASSVTFVSSTQITFTSPARAAGTYDIYVVNPGGATAIFVFGISYSGLPTWTTPAGSLGEVDGTFSVQLQATSNSAVSYSLATGSTLPSGVALSSSGLLTGTGLSVEQTFSFTAVATDLENQDTPRSFQVTVVLGDPLFDYNVLLLTGNGTNTAQNNTFLDSSTNNFTITRNGNTTQGAFSPYGDNWSNLFPGAAGTWLSVPNDAGFQFGTGDFTIEAWIFLTGNTVGDPNGNRGGAICAGVPPTSVSNSFWFQVNGNSTTTGTGLALASWTSGSYADVVSGNFTVTQNTWHHVAATRSGNTTRLFLNGVLQATNTYTGSVTAGTSALTVGYAQTGTSNNFNLPFPGYISNLRIVKGTAVYTANFTPSTAPLTAISGTSLLTCQSNRFRDNSTNNFTVSVTGSPSVQRFSPFNPTAAYSTTTIGGSGYFNGSAQWLTVPDNAAFEFAGGSFSIDLWINTNSLKGYQAILSKPGNVDQNGWILYFETDNQIRFNYGNGYWMLSPNTFGTINPGTWNHLAVTRDTSNNWRMFLNGRLISHVVNSGNINDTSSTLFIGWYPNFPNSGNTAQSFGGYMSNIRIVKGGIPTLFDTATTTANTQVFTPPTAPYTGNEALTGGSVSFLGRFTNAGIIDNAIMNNIETVGNAQISTAQSRFGGSSILFDGTDDRLTAPANPGLAFGTGDFTVEFWMNSNNVAGTAQRGLLQTSDTVGGLKTTYTSGITIHQGINASQGAMNGGLGANIAGTFIGSNTAVLNTGTWYHIALVRLNGTVTIYVNGAVHASGIANGNCSGQFICIGGYYDTNYLYNGYIDDLRITDLARYSTSFTAPTIAHRLR